MSAAQEPDEGDVFGSAYGPDDGGLYTLRLLDTAEEVSAQPDIGDARLYVERESATIHTLKLPAVAEDFDQVWGFVGDAWDNGTLPFQDTGNFFRYLRYNLGIPVVTTAMVATGVLAAYLLKYDQEHGIAPAKEPTFQPSGELSSPTHGQRSVAGAAQGLTPQRVTAPGLTPTEALAIQKAIGAATADVLRVQALVIDRMLPGMAPGQVPEALTQLNTAASVLEHQVHALQRQMGDGSLGHVAGKVSGVAATLAALQGEVKALNDQMTGDVASGLLGDVDTLREATAANTLDLHEIGKELPKLATTAALTALTAHVDVVTEDLALKHASALDTALNTVEHRMLALQAQADDNAQCCDATSEVTNPIKQGGATPSLLKSLGSLLKGAVEGVFIASFLDVVLMIFDAPAVISTTVIDTGTMSEWAISAAHVIEQDMSWLGRVGNG